MKHLQKFENYIKQDDFINNIKQKKKEYISFEEEPNNSTEIKTETPIEVKSDEDRGYGLVYPQELEQFGEKGLNFYKYLLDQNDGPVDEYVALSRAFLYVGSDKTPDGSILYTIKNPVKKQEIEMAANVYEIAIKTIQKEGGKLPTNEPTGEYE